MLLSYLAPARPISVSDDRTRNMLECGWHQKRKQKGATKLGSSIPFHSASQSTTILSQEREKKKREKKRVRLANATRQRQHQIRARTRISPSSMCLFSLSPPRQPPRFVSVVAYSTRLPVLFLFSVRLINANGRAMLPREALLGTAGRATSSLSRRTPECPPEWPPGCPGSPCCISHTNVLRRRSSFPCQSLAQALVCLAMSLSRANSLATMTSERPA